MASDSKLERSRVWYSRLLGFYPQRFRDRFAEGMEQTFADVYRERRAAGRGVTGFVFGAFAETFIGILVQHVEQMRSSSMTRDTSGVLKTVRLGAIGLALLLVCGIVTVMVLARGTGEDITGVVAPALLLVIVSAVVAVVTTVAAKRAGNHGASRP